MVLALVFLGVAVLWVPAIWITQAAHDWWVQPDRAWHRKLWLIDHELQAWLSRLDRGPAGCKQRGASPRARPSDKRSGAGPKPLVADRHPPHGDQGQHRATTAHSPLGGGPARTPAGVTDPRTVAPTGHHKQPVVDPPEPTTGPTPTGDPAGGEQGCESSPPTSAVGGLAHLGERP